MHKLMLLRCEQPHTGEVWALLMLRCEMRRVGQNQTYIRMYDVHMHYNVYTVFQAEESTYIRSYIYSVYMRFWPILEMCVLLLLRRKDPHARTSVLQLHCECDPHTRTSVLQLHCENVSNEVVNACVCRWYVLQYDCVQMSRPAVWLGRWRPGTQLIKKLPSKL